MNIAIFFKIFTPVFASNICFISQQFRTRFCLLASANITIVVIGEKNVSVIIPDNSTVKVTIGCGLMGQELVFVKTRCRLCRLTDTCVQGECGDVLDDVNEEVEKVVLQPLFKIKKGGI